MITFLWGIQIFHNMICKNLQTNGSALRCSCTVALHHSRFPTGEISIQFYCLQRVCLLPKWTSGSSERKKKVSPSILYLTCFIPNMCLGGLLEPITTPTGRIRRVRGVSPSHTLFSPTLRGDFRVSDRHKHACYWSVGGNQSLGRKPTQTQGDHANSSQKHLTGIWTAGPWRCEVAALTTYPPCSR